MAQECSSRSSAEGGFKWTRNMTVLLNSLVKENYDRLQTGVKKTVHQMIANKINYEFNTKISFEQVDSKWKGLKKTYKKVKEENDQTGQAKKYWEYFDLLHEFLYSAPEINPPAILSSEDVEVQIADHLALETNNLDSNIALDEPPFTTNLNRKRKSTAAEDRVEKRHREQMEVSNKFLDIFQQMVDKM